MLIFCAQDLGCGDAGPIAKLVSAAAEQGRPLVRKYTGVDLSKPALSLAQANLARCSPSLLSTSGLCIQGCRC